MLDMTPFEFDQSENGWRKLDKQGLFLEAAELIASYVAANIKIIEAQNQVSIQTLYFHAGQEYACAGKKYYAKAISFFSMSHKSKEGWDVYVDGTIAFLENDKKKLKQAANALKKLTKTDAMQLSNANLLQEFLYSLEINQSYLDAYGG